VGTIQRLIAIEASRYQRLKTLGCRCERYRRSIVYELPGIPYF
jgi:hypothetical protein